MTVTAVEVIISYNDCKIQVDEYMVRQSTKLQSIRENNEDPLVLKCNIETFDALKELCYYHHVNALKKDISADDVAKWEYEFFKALYIKKIFFYVLLIAQDLSMDDYFNKMDKFLDDIMRPQIEEYLSKKKKTQMNND